jgi:hypothetical protein
MRTQPKSSLDIRPAAGRPDIEVWPANKPGVGGCGPGVDGDASVSCAVKFGIIRQVLTKLFGSGTGFVKLMGG